MDYFDHSLHQNDIYKEAKNEHWTPFNSTLRAIPEPANKPAGYAGPELTASDLEALDARWINPELAQAARLRRVDSFIGAELVGRKSGDYSGIAIPYSLPGSTEVREYRLRCDHPEMEVDSNGRVKRNRNTSVRLVAATCSTSRPGRQKSNSEMYPCR